MRIALFLTYGYGLDDWDRAGVLDRELSLYQDHYEHGIKTLVVSYGSKIDMEFVQNRPYIDLIFNEYNLPNFLYARMLPFVMSMRKHAVDLIKTNQMYGAHVALSCARRLNRPIFIRQGHSFFESEAGAYPNNHKIVRKAREYEAYHLKRADLVTFPTTEMAERAVIRHQNDQECYELLPNFVEPEAWEPHYNLFSSRESNRIIFFGKFTKQKNLDCLIKAVKGLPVKLVLIGSGPERANLEGLAIKLGIDVEFPGRVAHELIKDHLRKAFLFILPSNYEGHPKALIEAMAFGIPVLATKSVGITPEIINGETGLLVENSVGGLRDGIQSYCQMSITEREKIGRAARLRVRRLYSRQVVGARERVLIERVLEANKR